MCERNNDQACRVEDEPLVLRLYALRRATLGSCSLAQQHFDQYCAPVDNLSHIKKGSVEEQSFATPRPRCQESTFFYVNKHYYSPDLYDPAVTVLEPVFVHPHLRGLHDRVIEHEPLHFVGRETNACACEPGAVNARVRVVFDVFHGAPNLSKLLQFILPATEILLVQHRFCKFVAAGLRGYAGRSDEGA
ncbi:hypothetical protein KDW40_25445 [Burkholderia cenocepacia]|uniref:hypothetical protein n=1 Tax=Burkholderia cenocepacia TaxID=95486 RepID=UPI001B91E676|nr:hypothetical protein [Burkholderia cenocepacia]MBR8043486.1 hypothetical protein [Burkholderia cenocepacia]MBR8329075.1 hypothetical protein [Burkholderia cenocepacia]